MLCLGCFGSLSIPGPVTLFPVHELGLSGGKEQKMGIGLRKKKTKVEVTLQGRGSVWWKPRAWCTDLIRMRHHLPSLLLSLFHL